MTLQQDALPPSEDIYGIWCQNLLFCLFFDEKLPIDNKQLLAVNLLLQNMPSEFEQGKPDFENPNTVLRWDEKQSLADLSHSRLLGFCLNMQHSTLWKRE